jgi:DNA-binding transcriptional ArsR family regulator
MAFSKASLFSEVDYRTADFAKAISHPARIEIMRLLAQNKWMICSEIVDQLPLTQPTVSQHLKKLRELNIVFADPKHITTRYQINHGSIEVIRGYLLSFLDELAS